MNRATTWINFVGVLIVAGLCVRQWGQMHGLEQSLGRTQVEQAAAESKVSELSANLASQGHDLDAARGQLASEDSQLGETRRKLTASTQETGQLRDERATTQGELQKWRDAVTDREKALQAAATEVSAVAAARDDAIKRYNELVVRMNAGAK